MKNKVISYLLILLITAFMAAPSLSIFSNSIDSSIFYSLNEEDTSTNENIKVFKVYNTDTPAHLAFLDSEKKNFNTSYFTLYTPYMTECTSPPPELV